MSDEEPEDPHGECKAEIDRLRAAMFDVGKCEGDREGFTYDECCGRICPWLENSHCAIDGWEMPDGEDPIR